MKALRILLLSLVPGFGLMVAALAQPTVPRENEPPPSPPPEEVADATPPAPDPADSDSAPEPAPVEASPNLDGSPGQTPEVQPAEPATPGDSQPANATAPSRRLRDNVRREIRPSRMLPPPKGIARGSTNGPANLRLNFRGVPLDMVLNYLSDAAGFIINQETDVEGTVDAWSNRPLTREEAVELLNTLLQKHGYAAIRNGLTLTIVNRDDAKKRDIPVISGRDPAEVPRSDAIVTQVIPVQYISATQMVKDLNPLLPTSAELSANEGGNALVLTDTQANIRRMMEIVQALDQAVSSTSDVRVFQLQFADSKALATTIQSLFQTQETSRNNNQNGPGRFFARFAGGPPGANGANGDAGSANGGRAPVPRVIAVADERSNSLIVSAPTQQMDVIANVVQGVDTNVDDITELRVYHLKNADPQETADLLTSLFEDSSSNSRQANNRGGFFRFGGRFGGGAGLNGRNGNANNATTSERMVKETRVTAVPDLRTRSVVVSAAKNLIDQIGDIVAQLDNDPARKQTVHIYSVENTDPEAVQEVIQSLFPEQNLNQIRNNSRNNQRQNANQLNSRQTQTRNQGNRTSNNNNLGNLGNAFNNGN